MPYQNPHATNDFTHSDWLIRCYPCAEAGKILESDPTGMERLPGVFKPRGESPQRCPSCAGDELQRSVMTFKSFTRSRDDLKISQMAVKNTTKFDAAKARAAKRDGKDYDPEVETEVRHSIALASIAYYARGWDGPEFDFPCAYPDPDDPKVIYTPGQQAPLTLSLVEEVLTSDQAEEIERFLNRLYAGRSEADEDSFQGNSTHLARPAGTGSAVPRRAQSDGRPAAAAAGSVPRDEADALDAAATGVGAV